MPYITFQLLVFIFLLSSFKNHLSCQNNTFIPFYDISKCAYGFKTEDNFRFIGIGQFPRYSSKKSTKISKTINSGILTLILLNTADGFPRLTRSLSFYSIRPCPQSCLKQIERCPARSAGTDRGNLLLKKHYSLEDRHGWKQI